eukprot:6992518-Prymnesium_polylepis.1
MQVKHKSKSAGCHATPLARCGIDRCPLLHREGRTQNLEQLPVNVVDANTGGDLATSKRGTPTTCTMQYLIPMLEQHALLRVGRLHFSKRHTKARGIEQLEVADKATIPRHVHPQG